MPFLLLKEGFTPYRNILTSGRAPHFDISHLASRFSPGTGSKGWGLTSALNCWLRRLRCGRRPSGVLSPALRLSRPRRVLSLKVWEPEAFAPKGDRANADPQGVLPMDQRRPTDEVSAVHALMSVGHATSVGLGSNPQPEATPAAAISVSPPPQQARAPAGASAGSSAGSIDASSPAARDSAEVCWSTCCGDTCSQRRQHPRRLTQGVRAHERRRLRILTAVNNTAFLLLIHSNKN